MNFNILKQNIFHKKCFLLNKEVYTTNNIKTIGDIFSHIEKNLLFKTTNKNIKRIKKLCSELLTITNKIIDVNNTYFVFYDFFKAEIIVSILEEEFYIYYSSIELLNNNQYLLLKKLFEIYNNKNKIEIDLYFKQSMKKTNLSKNNINDRIIELFRFPQTVLYYNFIAIDDNNYKIEIIYRLLTPPPDNL